MSYKIDLSELDRDSRSLTQELVQRFADAIEDGRLRPGEKLPPTRELARLAEINPLTAARVYRRLRELGYLTAVVGQARSSGRCRRSHRTSSRTTGRRWRSRLHRRAAVSASFRMQ